MLIFKECNLWNEEAEHAYSLVTRYDIEVYISIYKDITKHVIQLIVFFFKTKQK